MDAFLYKYDADMHPPSPEGKYSGEPHFKKTSTDLGILLSDKWI